MKIKRMFKSLLPLFFALFAFLSYIVIFSPALGTQDFTTALLAFFAGLGSAALVLFTRSENLFLLRFYTVVSLFVPALFLFVVKVSKIHSPLHYIVFALMAVGFLYLRLFVAAHRDQERSGGTQEESISRPGE